MRCDDQNSVTLYTRQNFYRTNGHHCKCDLWNLNAKDAFREKQTRSSEEGHSTVLNKTPSVNLVQVSPCNAAKE